MPSDSGFRTALQVGRRSSFVIAAIGVAYAIVLAVGMATFGLSTPIGDPILAVMEVLTILSALPVVTLMAAVHGIAPDERRLQAVVALGFALLFAGTTTAVHFVELTAGRALGTRGMVWPSPAYAAELLAWDLFLGLALLAASAALPRDLPAALARRLLSLAGWLALLGLVGPIVRAMRIQLIGVVGYAIVLPMAAVVLARWFGGQLQGR